MQQQFTVTTPQGQKHKVQGDSSTTLRDLLGEVGKTGGQPYQPGAVRFRCNGKEFGDRDLDRPVSELGIDPNTPIEIVS